MPALYTNNIAGVTATDIGPSDTVILLSAGQGAQFPQPTSGQWFWATLIHPVSHVVEIVQCTARSADSLTVVRGRDSTTAVAFPASTVLEMRVVAEMFREVEWRSKGNQPNGIPILDSGGKVGTAQLPDSIPYMVGGVVPLAALPTELLTETEGNAAYGRKDAVNTWAENQTFNKAVAVRGRLTVGVLPGDNAIVDIGDDLQLRDVGRANTLGVVGSQDTAKGAIQFGVGATAGVFEWDPPTGNFRVLPLAGGSYGIFHGGNFNPATKVDAQSGVATDLRCARGGFPATYGILYYGTSAYIQFDSANFIASNNFYAPNLIGTSDRRLKKNIRRQLAVRNIGDMVSLHSWDWRRKEMPNAPGGRQNGPIAQDVQKYAPHHVSKRDDGVLGVDKAGLALEVGVDNAARCRVLEAQVAELTAQIKQLMKKPR